MHGTCTVWVGASVKYAESEFGLLWNLQSLSWCLHGKCRVWVDDYMEIAEFELVLPRSLQSQIQYYSHINHLKWSPILPKPSRLNLISLWEPCLTILFCTDSKMKITEGNLDQPFRNLGGFDYFLRRKSHDTVPFKTGKNLSSLQCCCTVLNPMLCSCRDKNWAQFACFRWRSN